MQKPLAVFVLLFCSCLITIGQTVNVRLSKDQSKSIQYQESTPGGSLTGNRDVKVKVEYWGNPNEDVPISFMISKSGRSTGLDSINPTIITVPGLSIPKNKFSKDHRNVIDFTVHLQIKAIAALDNDEFFEIELKGHPTQAGPSYRVSIQKKPVTDTNYSGMASVEFVGDGNIQPSHTSGSTIPANTGVGIIYRERFGSKSSFRWLHNIELDVSINIASTVDTLRPKYSLTGVTNKSDYGNSVLQPINSGQAYSAAFKGYFSDGNGGYHNLFNALAGFYINVIGSNRNWADSSRSVKGSTVSFQAGFFTEFLPPDLRENASISLGFGYTGRWILGDVSLNENDAFRSSLTGSKKTSFNGFEFILSARIRNIKAEVRVPFLSKKDGIPGLSGTQPNTSIGFVGGFTIAL